MKGKIIIIACITLTLISFNLWQQSSEVIAGDTLIRFHVIANSDGAEDQSVKLKVRDGILARFSQDMSACGNYEEARKFLVSHQNEMVETAESILKENGFNYGAEVEIGVDSFPTKSYGDITLAAGDYQAVKVILGQGEGKNWWCVMYPPLCFVDISQNVGIAKIEYSSPENNNNLVAANGGVTEVKIKSKLAELFK